MNFIAGTFGRDLELESVSYDYDPDSFEPLYSRLAEKIAAYDPDFGPYLSGHLSRVARDVEQFMIRIGYDEDVSLKIGHAFALHDLGKIKQDPELWRLTADKRELTPAQKQERPKHTDLGIEVLDETIAELGLDLTNDQKSHIAVVKYLMQSHHERLDGSGPKGMSAPIMDQILRICAIVDTVDGKTKAKTLTQIFDDMSGSKHAGQFDLRLVSKYQAYYTASRAHGEPVPQPVLANLSLSR